MNRFARPIVPELRPALVWGVVAAALIGLALGVALDQDMMARTGFGAAQADGRTAVLILIAIAAASALAVALSGGEPAPIDARDAKLVEMSWRLDLALGASKVGFWDVDLETGDLSWDDRACGLFGIPKREGFYSEADWVGVLHPDDRERAVAAANASVAQGETFVYDYRVVWPDGQVRHIRDMAAYYQSADGGRRLMGLVWDRTADKEREEELDLRRREAEAADVAKSNFLAAMSHEIRTPLTGVIGMLDLVAAEPLSKAQADRVRIAGVSARGLLQLLNDVLDFSKLEAEAIVLRPERVRLRDLIGGVTELMAARAMQKGLALTCTVAPETPEWIMADAVRLRQVLTNIVSNAIAFTRKGGVTVEAGFAPTAGGGMLSVAVRDTGVGIAEADRERIFERFVQADSTLSRGTGGAGLGLAIARQLVGLMGGEITVESAEGRGSTFRFTAAVELAAPEPAPAPDGNAAGEPLDALPPLRILVAEDNATNQHLIKALLASRGHAVTVVPNGREAVWAVAEGAFDVVLMDIQMPEMDGPTATRAIRNLSGPMASVPIIALTASVLAGDQARYLASGMTDYVAKPIDRAALGRALRRALSPEAEGGPQDRNERRA